MRFSIAELKAEFIVRTCVIPLALEALDVQAMATKRFCEPVVPALGRSPRRRPDRKRRNATARAETSDGNRCASAAESASWYHVRGWVQRDNSKCRRTGTIGREGFECGMQRHGRRSVQPPALRRKEVVCRKAFYARKNAAIPPVASRILPSRAEGVVRQEGFLRRCMPPGCSVHQRTLIAQYPHGSEGSKQRAGCSHTGISAQESEEPICRAGRTSTSHARSERLAATGLGPCSRR